MPMSKKPKSDARKKPPDPPPHRKQLQQSNEASNGRSGRGADSVLAHLIEQEKNRGRKPERD
jgi:hypothetical protein